MKYIIYGNKNVFNTVKFKLLLLLLLSACDARTTVRDTSWKCYAVRSIPTPKMDWGDSLYVCNCYYITNNDTISVSDSLIVYPETLNSDNIDDYEQANEELRPQFYLH